jgi:hypothetical protein
MNDQQPTDEQAVAALAARGVDNGAHLLIYATPDEILATCRWFDGRQGVGPGLLAKRIRDQDFPTEPPPARNPIDEMHAKFDDYARQFLTGTVIRSPHYRTVPIPDPPPNARIWDRLRTENCPGTVRITGANYPFIQAECDSCRYDCATPVNALHTIETT